VKSRTESLVKLLSSHQSIISDSFPFDFPPYPFTKNSSQLDQITITCEIEIPDISLVLRNVPSSTPEIKSTIIVCFPQIALIVPLVVSTGLSPQLQAMTREN
jgi:hypothetical protein